MANRWLAQKLIANAKRRGWIVASDDPTDGFGEDDFLELIDDVIRARMVPLLKRTREAYLVTESELELTSGRAQYPLPVRAAAEALRSILIETETGAWPPLDRIEPEEAYRYSTETTGTPIAYYMKDDSAVFVPTPGDAVSVRFIYFNRPSRLVPATSVSYISAIDTDERKVTLWDWDEDDGEFTSTATPGASEELGADSLVDIVKGQPGFRCLGIDLEVTGIFGPAPWIIQFAEELPDGLAVGDFVCLPQESPIAQIPAELHPMLAHEVTRTILEARGDAKADRAAKTVERMEEDAKSMLSPRTTETSRFIQNRNLPGWGRFRKGFWR